MNYQLSSSQYLRFFLSCCITIAIALTEYCMFTTTLMYGCSVYNFIVLRRWVSCWRGIISPVWVSVQLGIGVSRWWLVIFLLLFVWSICLTINSIFCLNLIYVNMLHVYSYFTSVTNGELMIFFQFSTTLWWNKQSIVFINIWHNCWWQLLIGSVQCEVVFSMLLLCSSSNILHFTSWALMLLFLDQSWKNSDIVL